MDDEKYSRQIGLLCPTCGHSQFSYDEDKAHEDDSMFKCAHCGLSLTKLELIERNQGVIEANVEEIAQEVMVDLKSELKKAFQGNKNIRIK